MQHEVSGGRGNRRNRKSTRISSPPLPPFLRVERFSHRASAVPAATCLIQRSAIVGRRVPAAFCSEQETVRHFKSTISRRNILIFLSLCAASSCSEFQKSPFDESRLTAANPERKQGLSAWFVSGGCVFFLHHGVVSRIGIVDALEKAAALLRLGGISNANRRQGAFSSF